MLIEILFAFGFINFEDGRDLLHILIVNSLFAGQLQLFQDVSCFLLCHIGHNGLITFQGKSNFTYRIFIEDRPLQVRTMVRICPAKRSLCSNVCSRSSCIWEGTDRKTVSTCSIGWRETFASANNFPRHCSCSTCAAVLSRRT